MQLLQSTYTNAKHQTYLGAHRDGASWYEARHTAVFTDTLGHLGRTAEWANCRQTACAAHKHTQVNAEA